MGAIYNPAPSEVTPQTDVAALTNSLTDTTTDGELNTMTGIDTVSQASLSRNLSELNVKINAINDKLVSARVFTEA